MHSMLNHWIGTPSAQNTHPVVLQQSDEAARDYFADGTQSHLFLTITDCDQKVFSPMNDDKVFKIANFGDYEALLDRSIHEIEYPHSLQTISRAEIDSISVYLPTSYYFC
jgi:hypothetical protein